MIKAKIRLSVFRLVIFLEKRNQIPINPNTINTDKNPKEVVRVVVISSATESVKASCLVRNGLAALRYLNLGNSIIPVEKIPIVAIIMEPRNARQFRKCVDSLLNFLMISQIITKPVEKAMRTPA